MPHPQQPETTETEIRTETEIITKPDGTKVKRVKKYKLRLPVVDEKVVASRKTWRKFGMATQRGNEGELSSRGDPIYFEFLDRKKSAKEEEASNNARTNLIDQLKAELDNITKTITPQSMAQKLGVEGAAGDRLKGDGASSAPSAAAAAGGKYIPPSMRAAMAAGGAAGAGSSVAGAGRAFQESEANCTVKVSNISEEVTEEDLEFLFRKVGLIQRTYVARYPSGDSKCFAFVRFGTPLEAQRAIKEFNRLRWDNLILNVELSDK